MDYNFPSGPPQADLSALLEKYHDPKLIYSLSSPDVVTSIIVLPTRAGVRISCERKPNLDITGGLWYQIS